MFLYLTEEQARVLEASPPVLISGTAGSGKTTLAVYYLLKPEFAGQRKLFLTYNPFLRDFSRRLYAGLTAQTGLEDTASRPDFYVFRDLLRDLLGPAVGAFNPDREVRLREFEGLFRNHRLYGRYDAELVWEEIRSIIKGAKPVLRLERWKSLSLAYLQGPLSRDRVLELKEGLLGLVNLETAPKIQAFLQSKTGFAGLEGLARSLTTDESLWRKEQGQALLEIFRILGKKIQEPLPALCSPIRNMCSWGANGHPISSMNDGSSTISLNTTRVSWRNRGCGMRSTSAAGSWTGWVRGPTPGLFMIWWSVTKSRTSPTCN